MATNKLTEQYVKEELEKLDMEYNDIEHISGPIYYVSYCSKQDREYNYDDQGKIVNIARHTEIDVEKFLLNNIEGYKSIGFEYEGKPIIYMYDSETDEFVADLSGVIEDVVDVINVYKVDSGKQLLAICEYIEIEDNNYNGQEYNHDVLVINTNKKRPIETYYRVGSVKDTDEYVSFIWTNGKSGSDELHKRVTYKKR